MHKNLIKLTIYMAFTSPLLAHSQDVLLGKYQKNVWNESLSDTFNGELVRLLHKKDDLFEKLAPELEIDLTPYIDLSTKFSRSVKEHLPRLKGEKLSPFDFSSFKVSNQFQLNLEAKANAGVLFSQGETGLRLVHSSSHVSSLAKDKCEFMHQILDQTTDQGKTISEAHCSENNKSLSSNYTRVVDYFSELLGRFFNQFADSERNKLFAEDPLAPLKLHSKLGVPLSPEIFEQKNHALHLGDVIEHTTFYGLKPLGVEFNIFEFIKPSFYKFRRLFRSVRFQKLPNNIIAIEVEDTQISGESTEVFKLRPKILAIIKLNFGKWAAENFSSESIVQRFEVDISKQSGKDFFKTVLKSMYTPSTKLFKGAIFEVSSSPAVKTKEPIYRDANGEETRLVLSLPGIFKYDRRNYAEVENEVNGNNSYLSAERLQREYLKSKFNFQLGPIGLSRKQRSHECSIEFKVNQKESGLNDSTLNFGCKYSNKYSEYEDKTKVLQTLDIALNGAVDPKDRLTLENLDLNRDSITMYNNVVFSENQLKNIFSASKEEITSEISKMMFGEDAKNIFSPRYRKIWKAYKNFRRSSMVKNTPLFKKCSVMLAYYGITREVDKTYDAFDGVVGNDKGIINYKRAGCYSYYRAANKLSKLVDSLKEENNQVANANAILEMFDDIKQTGLAQNLLIRLAGGINSKGLTYSYLVSSPKLSQGIYKTNQKVQETVFEKERDLAQELGVENFSRIKQIEYSIDPKNIGVLKVYIKLHYELENPLETSIDLKIANFSYNNEEDFKEIKISFAEMSQLSAKEFELFVPLDYDYDYNSGHNAYLRLLGSNNRAIGKETKTYLNSYDKLTTARQN